MRSPTNIYTLIIKEKNKPIRRITPLSRQAVLMYKDMFKEYSGYKNSVGMVEVIDKYTGRVKHKIYLSGFQ